MYCPIHRVSAARNNDPLALILAQTRHEILVISPVREDSAVIYFKCDSTVDPGLFAELFMPSAQRPRSFEPRVTDLPFRVSDSSIVILKSLPVLQCNQFGETELKHATILRIEQLLDQVDQASELEVIRFAA